MNEKESPVTRRFSIFVMKRTEVPVTDEGRAGVGKHKQALRLERLSSHLFLSLDSI